MKKIQNKFLNVKIQLYKNNSYNKLPFNNSIEERQYVYNIIDDKEISEKNLDY